MNDTRQEFIEFAMRHDVLRFGEFKLKSGRVSPYFFNAGLFNTGEALAGLGRFYAQAILEADIGFDMLFGPAYKGIPLAAAAAIALAEDHGRDVPWAFNRKEAKDHGEGGDIIGAPLEGRVLIVDDVITAGTAVGEAVTTIKAHGAEPCGVIVCLDREERGDGERSALDEAASRHGLRAVAVAGLADLLTHLRGRPEMAESLASLEAYRARYGVRR